MKLNKTIALVAMILLTAVTLLGCGGTPVLAAKVGDQEITVTQLENSYYNSLSYASAYGFDTATEDGVTQFRDYLLDNLISSAMEIYQAKLAGITLTDEELAAAKETAENNYDDTFASFVEQATNAGSTNAEAYAKKLFTDALIQNKTTVKKLQADMLEDAMNEALVSKHRTALLDNVKMTDEELLAKYNEVLADQKGIFEQNPSSYFSYQTYAQYGYNAPPLYVPNGFFRVRHILVTDEVTANLIKTKIDAGEDFEALLAEYNTDPGMQSEENAAGYLAGEGASFVEPFLNAALALTKDGDVSAPVESDFGWHIIKRVSTEPAREIPYAEVKETFELYEQALYLQQYHSDLVSGWIMDESLVTRFPENYASVGK
ncbi:MAG: peptidyl-prolyl cis-trans isomerase [Eubacteriales bacterium]|jgi:foldase protein PrsA|nr:peptidyl-prolyl cis-trans isomerase [Eubacteriales bacterium]